MIQHNGGKLLKRFFEPLMLLAALGQVQGERIASGPLGLETSDASTFMQRRRILSDLCAMCDFKKGGETVTAIALEAHPGGPVYWLATNGPARNKVVTFLKETLEALGPTDSGNIEDGRLEKLEKDLFMRFTEFNRPRLVSTWLFLQKSIGEELERISNVSSRDDEFSK